MLKIFCITSKHWKKFVKTIKIQHSPPSSCSHRGENGKIRKATIIINIQPNFLFSCDFPCHYLYFTAWKYIEFPLEQFVKKKIEKIRDSSPKKIQ